MKHTVRMAGLIFGTLLILSAAAATRCSRSGSWVMDPEITSMYRYTAMDSAGGIAARGFLCLDLADGRHVTGTWSIEAADTEAGIGPQTGSGKLQGTFQDGRLEIDLNPEYRDNNVYLSGTFTGLRYHGYWIWSGFAGPVRSGSFQSHLVML